MTVKPPEPLSTRLPTSKTLHNINQPVLARLPHVSILNHAWGPSPIYRAPPIIFLFEISTSRSCQILYSLIYSSLNLAMQMSMSSLSLNHDAGRPSPLWCNGRDPRLGEYSITLHEAWLFLLRLDMTDWQDRTKAKAKAKVWSAPYCP